MTRTTPHILYLAHIYRQIRDEVFPSTGQLAEDLEVSQRTIYQIVEWVMEAARWNLWWDDYVRVIKPEHLVSQTRKTVMGMAKLYDLAPDVGRK